MNDHVSTGEGFTAADMADQYATAFERGRESVLAELCAAAQEAVVGVIDDMEIHHDGSGYVAVCWQRVPDGFKLGPATLPLRRWKARCFQQRRTDCAGGLRPQQPQRSLRQRAGIRCRGA